jgi:hypothetical protein
LGEPVVVLWGSARSEVPADATISGVRFLDGRELLTWLAEWTATMFRAMPRKRHLQNWTSTARAATTSTS